VAAPIDLATKVFEFVLKKIFLDVDIPGLPATVLARGTRRVGRRAGIRSLKAAYLLQNRKRLTRTSFRS
jgi:hypothetical protein